MVRRWSYVNTLNTPFQFTYFRRSTTSLRVRFIYQELAFFDSTLFRKKLARQTISKFRRLGWSRRKHRAEWVLYRNILVHWAQDYRFFRRYNRFILLLHLFKNSYFVFNLPLMMNVAVAEINEFRSIHLASLVSRTMRYFYPLNPKFYQFFRAFQCLEWAYASSPFIPGEDDLMTTSTDSLLYHLHQQSFYTTKDISEYMHWMDVLIQFFFQTVLQTMVAIYRVLTLLVLYRL